MPALELHPVINQADYPGIDPVPQDGLPDVDDCQFIAAIWGVTGADPDAERPNLQAFRRAAGKPDTVGVQGASVHDVARGMPKTWPGQPFTVLTNWAAVDERLDAGDYVSISVLSSELPLEHRFGFRGPHQGGAVRRDGRTFFANPLAPDGSAPLEIDPARLRHAARALTGTASVLAIAFAQVPRYQVRVLPPSWGRFRFVDGELRRRRLPTLGFSAKCGAPEPYAFGGKVRQLVRIREGKHKGDYANRTARLVRVRSRNL